METPMPLTSVPTIYDGKHITLLEDAPVDRPYRVLVTFVGPVVEREGPTQVRDRFLTSFGAWHDDRPIEATLADIYEARRSRSKPAKL